MKTLKATIKFEINIDSEEFKPYAKTSGGICNYLEFIIDNKMALPIAENTEVDISATHIDEEDGLPTTSGSSYFPFLTSLEEQ